MSYNLITYLSSDNFNKKKKYFYYGALNEKTYKIIKENYSVINYIDSSLDLNKDKKIENLEYCERLYEKILKDFIVILNKIHNVDYKEKYWKLILGRYLKELIYVTYNRYKDLENLIIKYNFREIYSLDLKDYELTEKDYLSFVDSEISSEWTSKLCTLIIKFIEKDSVNKIKFLNQKNLNENRPINKKKNYKLKFKKIIFYFLNKFFNKKKIFFYETTLDFFFEKKLELKLKQIPSFFNFDSFKENKKLIDNNLRNLIKFNFYAEDIFQKFLKKNLVFLLPTYLIESFHKIRDEVEKSNLPKNPKLLITATGFINEYYNFYAANSFLKGAKYCVLQHGSSYNTCYEQNYLFENSNVVDSIYTWGFKKNNNQVPLFNINVLKNKIIKLNYNANGYLTIVCNKLSSRPAPYNQFNYKKKEFFSTVQLVKKLPTEIKNKTIFRLFPEKNNHFNNFLKNYLIDSNLKFFEDDISFSNILKKTKVCLFNYESTGFYENLLNNFVSIVFFQDFSYFNDEALHEYNKLKKANVVFTDQDLLVKQLILIWNNPYSWWESKNVKNAIDYFNNKYNNKPLEPMNKLRQTILQTYNK